MLVKAEKEEIASKAAMTFTLPMSTALLHDSNVSITKVETTLKPMVCSSTGASSIMKASTRLTMSLALSEETTTPLAFPLDVPSALTRF